MSKAKFHFLPSSVLWLLENMSGLSRTEMPGAMPKAVEGEAVSALRTELVALPVHTASEMADPTPAIILQMCKTIITIADSIAALPEDTSTKLIEASAHPSKFSLLKKFYEDKLHVPLLETKGFAKKAIKFLTAIHDEVNRPSTGKHDRTQFEITADATVEKESKLQKGKDALKDSTQGKGGKGGKGGKAKKPRAPAPPPTSTVFTGNGSGVTGLSTQDILKVIAMSASAPAPAPAAAASSGSSATVVPPPVDIAMVLALVQQQQLQLTQLQHDKESKKRARNKAASGNTAPSQRARKEGSSLNDQSYAASRSDDDEGSDSDDSGSGDSP